MDHLDRNQTFLFKIQSAEGTEETPTPGSDAIKVRQTPRFIPNIQNDQTNFVRGTIDRSASVAGGGNAGWRLPIYFRGAGTAGEAPEEGPLYRVCAMSETLTATAVADTAQSGAASTITLASGESATDDIYVGMPITLTGGTGSGQTRVITDYVGSTKVATVYPAWSTEPDDTSEYSIDKNALYETISAGFEVGTAVGYLHHRDGTSNSRRRRAFDCAGALSLQVAPRGFATGDVTLTGILPAKPDDVAKPADPTFTGPDPRALMGALAYLGASAVNFSNLRLDWGNTVEQPDDPAATFGFGTAGVVERALTGSFTLGSKLKSVRDPFGDWLEGTARDFWMMWGDTAGEKVSLYMPGVRFTGSNEAEVRGFAADEVPFEAPNGLYLAFL